MLKKLFSKLFNAQKGQSMAEIAIATPILLIVFLGMVEVGWVLRGHVVLSNATREAARFAAKGEYLDFRETDTEDVGYSSVMEHSLTSLSEQLPFDLTSENPNGDVIITHYLIDTGKPCADPPCAASVKACEDPAQREAEYTSDDLILHPGVQGYEYLAVQFGSKSHASELNNDEIVADLTEENNVINCKLSVRNPNAAVWSPNSVIVVETFYDQAQLLGVPFISNPFTDPVVIKSQTKMRLAKSEKEARGCELLPIGINEDTVASLPGNGESLVDVREGAGTGNFGWLRWRDGKSSDETISANTNSAPYLTEEINNTKLSIHDFQDATDPTDTALNAGDNVWGLTGQTIGSCTNETSGAACEAVNSKIDGRFYYIPVWDTASGSGSNLYYHVVGFAKIQLTAVDMHGSPKTISAKYYGMSDICPGNGS